MNPGSKCLFCHGTLGSNEMPAVEVGRRVAFDPLRGRLWVVCWRCRGWNLFPLDRRWEGLETCERHWREAVLKYSTDNIGLARLPDGCDLIRIGKSTRAEFAAWRYGVRFSRRRRAAQVRLGVGAGVVGAGAILAGAAVTSGVSLVAVAYGGAFAWTWLDWLKNPALTKVPVSSDWEAEVRRGDLKYVRLMPDPQVGWRLGTGLGELQRGAEALLTLALLLPHINRRGGSRSAQDEALTIMEERADPERLIEHVARQSYGSPLRSLKKAELFALEMAVNEDAERQLVGTELRLLEKAWKEAEQVAAIADSLLMPAAIEKRVADLKSRRVVRAGGSGGEREVSARRVANLDPSGDPRNGGR